MAKLELRERALKLRKEENLSLKEIASRLKISKSTASLWLRFEPRVETDEEKKRRYEKIAAAHRKNRGTESKIHSLFGNREFSRHEKGKIAEAAVLLRLVAFGFEVFGSPFDGDRADWVIKKDNKTAVIQVKWAGYRGSGLPTIKVRCTEGHNQQRPYRDGELDYLVGYDFYTDVAYVYSWEELRNKKTISVSPYYAEKFEKIFAE